MPKGRDIAWIVLTLVGVALVVSWQASRVRQSPSGAAVAEVEVPGSATPSIDDPSFEPVNAADLYLKDDGEGLALELGGKRRFYPFQVLVWHGAVNDEMDGVPVLVTYAPLAGTSGAFDRRADGVPLRFDTTDTLRNGASDVLDREAKAVGPDRLARLPSVVTTWRAWRTAHPDGAVLARPAAFDRDYTHDPYAEYRTGAAVWYPVEPKDARLAAKERVVGARDGTAATAYRMVDVARQLFVQDAVGTLPLLLMYDRELDAVRAFDRRVGAGELSFVLDDDHGVVDEAGRSVWDARGVARRGPMKGRSLREVPIMPAYWFHWAATNPNTNLWQP